QLDHRADDVAPAEVGESCFDVVERDPLRHHPGQVELPIERPLGEPWKVLRGQVVAAVGDEYARALVEGRRELDPCGRLRLRQAYEDGGAGMGEEAKRQLERRGQADDVEGEIDLVRLARMRRAEPTCRLDL